MSFYSQGFIFTDLFLEMQCDRNEEGTRNLVLRGNDLFKKIGKRVCDSDLLIIVDFLRRHPEIIALDFPYNEITDCGISALVDFFKERPVIRYLNLMGNNIGERGVGYLVSVGSVLPLYSLRLTGNKIGNEGGEKLFKLLCSKTVLKCLDVSDTHQTVSGLAYLMTALIPSRGGSDTLEYVNLSSPLTQEYHQMCDAHVAEFVGQVLQNNKTLKELHIQKYGFDPHDIEVMLEGLSFNNTIVCLDLNNNNIADDGVKYLCQYLKTTPPLECLMIGANNIGDKGATTLSFSLPFSKIKVLDISNNKITDEGMKNILYTIRKKEPMRGLFIWGNKITHESSIILQRLFNNGVLNSEYTDVSLYCTDFKLHASWNSHANRYTHRFYCVSDYGFPPMRKLKRIPNPPVHLPPIYYKHHVDDEKMGFPVCLWHRSQFLYSNNFPF